MPGEFKPISGVDVRFIKENLDPGIRYEHQIFSTFKFLLANSNAFRDFDLLWTHSLLLNFPALRIKSKFKIPLLYAFHGIRNLSDDYRLFIYYIGACLSFKKIDYVVGASDFVTEQARCYGARARRIYLGCDTEKFQPRYSDEKFMLTVGELTRHKRVEVPIRISAELNIPLKIVGEGVERKRLERYARKLGSDVEFCGLVSDLELLEMYQRCSFFVSGSMHEAFGLALLEANACGKPVIARNCSAVPEIIRHGVNGFLCEDLEDFTHFAKLLWIDHSLRLELGKNGRKWAETFSWKKAASQYLEVFKEICRNKEN